MLSKRFQTFLSNDSPMTAKLFSLSNRLQHWLSGPHNGTDNGNDIDIWFHDIDNNVRMVFNGCQNRYILFALRGPWCKFLDRARVSRLCRPLYVCTHNTTRLCHMTLNNLSTRIFGTGFSFLSPSIQRHEFSVSRRAYKMSERLENFNIALSLLSKE